jgi:hypothetical protein
MYMIANGTHSAIQRTSASTTAVEISIDQLLPRLSIFMQAVVLTRLGLTANLDLTVEPQSIRMSQPGWRLRLE